MEVYLHTVMFEAKMAVPASPATLFMNEIVTSCCVHVCVEDRIFLYRERVSIICMYMRAVCV